VSDPAKAARQAQISTALRLDRQGLIPEAIEAYKRVLALWPELAECWYNLGVLMRKSGQLSAALTCYQSALNRGVERPEEVHLNRGVIYSDFLKQYEAAEREIMAALSLRPTYLAALFNLANLHEDLGRRAQAAAVYEQILALDPEHFEALARYAHLCNFSDPQDPLIARLHSSISHPRASAADRAALNFALGRALDSCGAFGPAFVAYCAANRESRASAPPDTGRYDRHAEEMRISRIIAAFPAQPTQLATLSANARPVTGPQPIFICGMFRSGSTLIEQLIADRTNVTAGGELEFLPDMVHTALAPFPESVATLPPARLESLAAQYLKSLAGIFPDATWVTDKRPDNFLYIGLIKLLFPQARIVHTRRNPLDNCVSIFFLHLDQRMSYALDLADTGHYYVQYRRLMQHWKTLYGADIHDVDYDMYVRDPDTEAGRLLDFLGVERQALRAGEQARARAVKTASVWQVREPIYQRSSGRANNYAGELAALREYLEP
jgi:tetratricopeptide (TPR) repeat protein